MAVFPWENRFEILPFFMSVKIGLVSLGCSKNLIDAEGMLYRLSQEGFKIVPDPALADVIIVNTCGFIEAAQQEAVDTILEMAQYKKTGRLSSLIVTGCMAQMFKEQIKEQIPEVDAVLGTGSYDKIAEAVSASLNGKYYFSFESINHGVLHAADRILSTPPYTAFIKIAEGCDNFCSYCAIPSLRGRLRSRTMEDIVKEATLLAGRGVKELIVVAQDITRYGEDLYGRCTLSSLLEKLCQIDGIKWIRLHYTYPEKITDDLLDGIASQEKILHYLDIPIQHCSGRLLLKMNRTGDEQSLLDLFTKIRNKIPDICLRTSLMTGFPSETEEDFSALCRFIQTVRFDRLGVFIFSPQENTPAYTMQGQVDEDVKQKRQETLLTLQNQISADINEKTIGKKLLVLCEGKEDGRYIGRSYKDSPDIDPKVYFHSKKTVNPGDFVFVTITGCDDYDLTGVCE